VRRPVRAWYQRRDRNVIAIRTDRYSPNHALIIDPVLTYGTYLGGSKDDWGQAIAVDSSGNAYVTGIYVKCERTRARSDAHASARQGVLNVCRRGDRYVSTRGAKPSVANKHWFITGVGMPQVRS